MFAQLDTVPAAFTEGHFYLRIEFSASGDRIVFANHTDECLATRTCQLLWQDPPCTKHCYVALGVGENTLETPFLVIKGRVI